jgi:hypothetical protein
MNKKNTFTLRLSDKQLTTLKDMAKQEKRTVSAIIRLLIDEIKTDKICTATQENGLQ